MLPLALLSLLVAFPTSPVPTVDAVAHVADSVRLPAVTSETASTRIYTPENERWFSELIDLNPTATVVVVGQGIAVSRTGGLVLPAGPIPADVTLS